MIDNIDKKILEALQGNCRRPIAEIAEMAGLSPSACHRRIGILENKGIIEGYYARLCPKALGLNMSFYVFVTLENQSESAAQDFETAAHARADILECHMMAGAADYIIRIAALDTPDYKRRSREIMSALPHIRRYESALILKSVKDWQGYPTLAT